MRPFTKLLFALLLILPAIAMTGCGPAEQEYVEAEIQEVSKADQLKQTIQPYADSGELDSGAEILPSMIEEYKAAGGANADELLQSAQELMGAGSPAKVKSIAAEMLKKIEG